MSVGRGALWGLAVFGAVSLVWGLYALITPESSDELPDGFSSSSRRGPGAIRVADALAANLGEPVLEGNRITPLHDGEEIFPAMLGAISGQAFDSAS